jgi:hypothetical protein
MALTQAERQQRRRERLQHQGLEHVQGWVTPDKAQAIRAIMQGLPTVWNPAPEDIAQDTPEAVGRDISRAAAPEIQTKPDAAPQKTRQPSAKTVKKWREQAEGKAPQGVSAVLACFQRVSGDSEIDYDSVPNMLSERAYKLACRAEVRSLRKEGLSWPKIAKSFNQRSLPLPKPGRGKWSGPRLRALLEDGADPTLC